MLCLQGFKQRFGNFLTYLLMRYLVMSDTSKAERQLSEKFGYSADGSWLPRSTAAAVIVSGDWALEWPFPIPPKVHVRHSSEQAIIERTSCSPEAKQGSRLPAASCRLPDRQQLVAAFLGKQPLSI